MKSFYKLLFLSFLIFLLFFAIDLPVFANQENITVTATVPPHPSDFQFVLKPIRNHLNFFPDYKVLYQINYGAKKSAGFPTNITIVASWVGNLDYIPENADNGYGNTLPVFDLLKRTITWNIVSLPPGITDQKVSFNLRSKSTLINEQGEVVTIKAKMNNQYVAMPDQVITNIYINSPNSLNDVYKKPTDKYLLYYNYLED